MVAGPTIPCNITAPRTVPATEGAGWRCATGDGILRGVIVTVLAHQGGWDEVLLAASPFVVFGVLLAVANRRSARAGGEPDPTGDETPVD